MDFNQKLKQSKAEIATDADRTVLYTLSGYFLFGIILAFFYDTWLVAILGGLVSLSIFVLAKKLFPGHSLRQYMAGLSLGLFMAQFIYQMHGMFEMHFTAFIAIIVLIAYQNWKLYLVPVLFVVVHHGSFAYIQYYGFANNIEAYQNIYFTQLNYMDLSTFIFHASLFAVGAVLCAFISYRNELVTRKQAGIISTLEGEFKKNEKNMEFANEIARGNLDIHFEPEESDALGRSLHEMRDSLVSSAEREKREKFIANGSAKVGEIIRDNINDLNELSESTIEFLVKYLGANQAAMFILHDEGEEREFEVTGCYAYSRRKYLHKKIGWGEGLVGQCALENDVIYLTDVPEDYVSITSGLGQALPRAIMMVPVATDDQLVGVIEIASFDEFEEYQQEFLRDVGADLASAIANLKTNQKMKSLYEESQEQAEVLRSQEEEMRQNMEEMQATQEEMSRQKMELEGTNAAIFASPILYAEYTADGELLNANQAFFQTFQFQADQVEGLNHRVFVRKEDAASEEYAAFWKRLQNGMSVTDVVKRKRKDGETVWLDSTYSTIQDGNGNVTKVVEFAYNVTDYHQISEELKHKDGLENHEPKRRQKGVNGVGKEMESAKI